MPSKTLWRLDGECKECGKRPTMYNEAELRDALSTLPGRTVLAHVPCAVCWQDGRRRVLVPVTVRAVREGQPVRLTVDGMEEELPAAPRTDPGLSPRQAEVCALVVEGLSDKRIALQLGVAFGTVRFHIDGAAARLCEADADRCRASPRGTIEAFYRARAEAHPPDEVFKSAA